MFYFGLHYIFIFVAFSIKKQQRNRQMKIVFSSLFSVLFIGLVAAQDANTKIGDVRVGVNYGYATQNTFPLDDRDYFYNSRFLKVQLNYILAQRRKFTYEIHVEPSIYFSNHRLCVKVIFL